MLFFPDTPNLLNSSLADFEEILDCFGILTLSDALADHLLGVFLYLGILLFGINSVASIIFGDF